VALLLLHDQLLLHDLLLHDLLLLVLQASK
jgi:hypothetical protein